MRKVVDCLLVLLVIINLLILISSYTSIFGYKSFKIISGSMEPNIDINSVVIVKPTKTYKVDNIITIKQQNVYYTHRIKKIDGDVIVTKGDNNNTEDKPININSVVGQVVYVLEDFKYLMLKASCILVLIISIVLSLFNRKDKKDVK